MSTEVHRPSSIPSGQAYYKAARKPAGRTRLQAVFDGSHPAGGKRQPNS